MANKLKVPKAVQKRFKVTGSGKIVAGRSFGRHLKHNKSKSQKRRLSQTRVVRKALSRKLKLVMGISTK